MTETLAPKQQMMDMNLTHSEENNFNEELEKLGGRMKISWITEDICVADIDEMFYNCNMGDNSDNFDWHSERTIFESIPHIKLAGRHKVVAKPIRARKESEWSIEKKLELFFHMSPVETEVKSPLKKHHLYHESIFHKPAFFQHSKYDYKQDLKHGKKLDSSRCNPLHLTSKELQEIFFVESNANE